jgi:hypothetical protein
MKYNYYCDKETKNTYRFQPDGDLARDFLGQATIYLKKSAVKALAIDPSKGLVLDILPRRGAESTDE